jgi:hypothetical protein
MTFCFINIEDSPQSIIKSLISKLISDTIKAVVFNWSIPVPVALWNLSYLQRSNNMILIICI